MEYRSLVKQLTPAVSISLPDAVARRALRPPHGGRGLVWAAAAALLCDLSDGYILADQFGAPGRFALSILGPTRLTLSPWIWLLIAVASLSAGWLLDRAQRGRARQLRLMVRALRFGALGVGGFLRLAS